MPRFRLRNAFLRGWFAARAQRALPRAYDVIEKVFMIYGFADGKYSGGCALPMLGNFALDSDADADIADDDGLKHIESDPASAAESLLEPAGGDMPEANPDLSARGVHPAHRDAAT